MARVTHSGGLSLNFSNLAVATTSVRLADANTILATISEPLEGFDGFGSVFIRGDDFVVRDGRLVSGDVEEIEFFTFTGGDGLQTSLEIEELDLSVVSLFEALSIASPLERIDAVANLVFGRNDSVTAGANDDFIIAGAGDDLVNAGGGNDVILAGAGSDVINGGDESVRPFGAIGAIFGGEDTAAGDLVSYATEASKVDVDLARGTTIEADGDVDRLNDIEGASGGLGDDKLSGDDGDNFFITSLGSDKVDGRGGVDVVSYRMDLGVVADLSTGKVVEASGGVDKLKNVEGVFGSSGDDTISGDKGDNILSGGFGGDDVLRGRGGDDGFVFSFNAGGAAVIKDFGKGDDTLVFDRSEFGIGGKFKLVVGDEPAAKGAASSFLFDVGSGELRLDADGRGSGGAVLVATLDKVTSLTLDDFVLI